MSKYVIDSSTTFEKQDPEFGLIDMNDKSKEYDMLDAVIHACEAMTSSISQIAQSLGYLTVLETLPDLNDYYKGGTRIQVFSKRHEPICTVAYHIIKQGIDADE